MDLNLKQCVILVAAGLSLLSTAQTAQGLVADEATLKAAGIRTLKSKHLILYTDLPSQPSVDELPSVFDQAIPQWATFFEVDDKTFEDWRVVACIVKNKERFREYGLLPRDIPPFLHGFQKFDEVWVYEQPSDYYRRHLLLHEGTHAAMNRVFGRVGPGWYREGIAEMLGTHRYAKGKLTMNLFPQDKKRVKLWGRIKIVHDAVNENGVRSIPDIVSTPTRAFLNVDSYAWCWALQSFGHNHPRFAPTFRQLQRPMYSSTRGVTERFLNSYYEQRYEMDIAWEVFLRQLDYGYDSSKETIVHSTTRKGLGSGPETFDVDVKKGWQSTGLIIPPKSTVDIAASGRFQLAKDSQPWISEPQGVTIEYYQQRPLGMLLSAVVRLDDPDPPQAATWSPVTGIGRHGEISTDLGGMLYLRINERADRMDDNEGKIKVEIQLQGGTINPSSADQRGLQ